MSTQSVIFTSPATTYPAKHSVRWYLQQAWAINPLLTLLLVAALAQFIISLVGLWVDPRIVVGMPNWAKNLKFALSFLLYTPTLLWIFSLIERHRKIAWWMATGIGVTLLCEIALLLLQAFRGQPMHFNVATPFDDALWVLMSQLIFLFYGFFLVSVLIYWRQLNQNRVIGWAIRLGLVIMVIGFGQGFLMTPPTADQLAQMHSGQAVATEGAHTVGAVDGGPGLPILGWSTEHGDLRIGHFIGIHGLQAIPLLGWWLSQRRLQRRLSEGRRLALVWIGAASYLGVVLLVTWQALRGETLLVPGMLTVSTWAALIVATVGMVLVVIRSPARNAN